jgi:hypothetical protein
LFLRLPTSGTLWETRSSAYINLRAWNHRTTLLRSGFFVLILRGSAEPDANNLNRFTALQAGARHSVITHVAMLTPDRDHQQNVIDQPFEDSSTVAATKICSAALWAVSAQTQLQGENCLTQEQL